MNAQVQRNVAPVDLFRHTHSIAWPAMLDEARSPTLFERATADALWKAYDKSCQSPNQFVAVSAATGAGKTLGAQTLMAHLFPARTALVIKEIKEAHEAYLHLCNLVGEQNVAIHTSVHRKGASRAEVAKFTKETGHEITHQYGETRFRNSPLAELKEHQEDKRRHSRQSAWRSHSCFRSTRSGHTNPVRLLVLSRYFPKRIRTPALATNPSSGAHASTVQRPSGVRVGRTSGSSRVCRVFRKFSKFTKKLYLPRVISPSNPASKYGSLFSRYGLSSNDWLPM